MNERPMNFRFKIWLLCYISIQSSSSYIKKIDIVLKWPRQSSHLKHSSRYYHGISSQLISIDYISTTMRIKWNRTLCLSVWTKQWLNYMYLPLLQCKGGIFYCSNISGISLLLIVSTIIMPKTQQAQELHTGGRGGGGCSFLQVTVISAAWNLILQPWIKIILYRIFQ